MDATEHGEECLWITYCYDFSQNILLIKSNATECIRLRRLSFGMERNFSWGRKQHIKIDMLVAMSIVALDNEHFLSDMTSYFSSNQFGTIFVETP